MKPQQRDAIESAVSDIYASLDDMRTRSDRGERAFGAVVETALTRAGSALQEVLDRDDDDDRELVAYWAFCRHGMGHAVMPENVDTLLARALPRANVDIKAALRAAAKRIRGH